MKTIGVLSDTHGLLRPEVVETLQDCDAIIHGGDINKQSIIDALKAIAPLTIVRGNNDKEWAKDLPEVVQDIICGIRVCLVHNKKFIPKDLAETDLVIYGHSHKYLEKEVDGIIHLNPGSCGPRKVHQEITLAKVYAAEGTYSIEKIMIPHPE